MRFIIIFEICGDWLRGWDGMVLCLMLHVVRMVIASLDSLIRNTTNAATSGACGSGRWPGGGTPELTDIWYGIPRNLVEAWGPSSCI